MQNKAGEGTASSTAATLVGASPINGRQAARLNGTDAGTFTLAGIPAIRPETGFDGSITVFYVGKLDTGLSGDKHPLWTLTGVDGDDDHYYRAFQEMSTPPYNAAGGGGLSLTISDDSETAEIVKTDQSIPTLVDSDPVVLAWRRDLADEADDYALFVNGYEYDAGSEDLEIKLNGIGFIGKTAADSPPSGYFGEFLIYTRALTDDEVATVYSYLLEKWDIPETTGVPS